MYGGSVSQRVPTLPPYGQPTRPAMSQSFSHPGQSYGGAFGSPLQNNDRQWRGGMGSPGSEVDPRFQTWGSTMLQQQQYQQQYPPSQGQVIFDRNLMNAENANKLGLSFHIAIQELDLIDLPAAHRFGKNCPYVSAACGKWTAATEVFFLYYYFFLAIYMPVVFELIEMFTNLCTVLLYTVCFCILCVW